MSNKKAKVQESDDMEKEVMETQVNSSSPSNEIVLEDSDDSDYSQESEADGSSEEEGFWCPDCPVVKISRSERKQACDKWKNSVIIKVLGKRVSLKFLQLKLLQLWRLLGEMEVINLEMDYFLVRKDSCPVLVNYPPTVNGDTTNVSDPSSDSGRTGARRKKIGRNKVVTNVSVASTNPAPTNKPIISGSRFVALQKDVPESSIPVNIENNRTTNEREVQIFNKRPHNPRLILNLQMLIMVLENGG
ncbi:hypothetical protein SESBI_44335 [Sesbania bispinosa]|nr:hypothetical protein SESBI_44335 [Sesbania bispinosa]